VEEKLRWTFSLYDINGDGFITREEMTDIVTAIYELMGRLPDECPEEEKIKGKVEQIFQVSCSSRKPKSKIPNTKYQIPGYSRPLFMLITRVQFEFDSREHETYLLCIMQIQIVYFNLLASISGWQFLGECRSFVRRTSSCLACQSRVVISGRWHLE